MPAAVVITRSEHSASGLRRAAGRTHARFGVELAKRTMSDLLRELNFSRVSVRPYHPQRDVAAQEAFKKPSPIS